MSIEINDSLWRERIALYAAYTKQGMVEALSEEWPYLVDVLIKLTPPKTLKQGRAAVVRDIRKTMRPFDPAAVRSEGIQEIVDKKDVAAYNLVAGRVKSGPMAGTRAVPFSPQVHTGQRTAYGRIGSDRRQVVLGPDAGLLRRYIRDVQGRVGWAKSGWLAALHLTGAKVAQSFVEKHGQAGGRVVDERGDAENPSITAINATPWASRRDEGHRITNDALQSRAISIVTKIKTKIRLASKQAGFDRAA